MADPKTPLEEMNQAIADLEAGATGEIKGLADKVASGFWNKVKLFFYNLAGSIAISLSKSIGPFNVTVTDLWKEKTARSRQTRINDLIENMIADSDDPRKMLDYLDAWSEEYPGMEWLITAFNVVTLFGGIIKAHTEALSMKASQTLHSEQRPALIPDAPLIEALFKDPNQEPLITDIMNRLGLSDEIQELLKIAGTVVLDPITVRACFLRGEIDDSQLRNMLHANRLSDESIELLKKLYEIIPPVQDIITMAVREVFSPDIIAKFGQMQDFPPEFGAWAKKQGLTEFWAKNYWAAHWSLPSPLQAFEMLHRDVIDKAELDTLLRALDIMPYWRGKLTQIAYRPFTRVDVRRMYDRGVLDESAVTRAYKDIGYDDNKAVVMTQFTKAFVAEPERQLTKADILSLYKKRGLTEAETVQRLMALGYPEDIAWLLLYRAAFEVESSMKTKAVSSVKKLYVAGKITETDAISKLSGYNMAATEINQSLEVWDLDRMNKVRSLTVKDIERFYKENIISIEATMVELRELGYNLQDSQRFIAVFRKGEEE